MIPVLTAARLELVLRIACVAAILGLGVISWGVLDPRPAPILIGLSVGQGLGVLSFLGFLLVVAADLGVKRRIKQRGIEAQAGDKSPKPPPAA